MNRKLIIAIFCTICLIIPLAACGNMGNLPKGEFLQSYDSPNSEFTINIYLCNGGATTDFSIRGEVVDNRNSNIKNIYWSYHEAKAEVRWIDEETVVINGHTLNVLKDVYDFRMN